MAWDSDRRDELRPCSSSCSAAAAELAIGHWRVPQQNPGELGTLLDKCRFGYPGGAMWAGSWRRGGELQGRSHADRAMLGQEKSILTVPI